MGFLFIRPYKLRRGKDGIRRKCENKSNKALCLFNCKKPLYFLSAGRLRTRPRMSFSFSLFNKDKTLCTAWTEGRNPARHFYHVVLRYNQRQRPPEKRPLPKEEKIISSGRRGIYVEFPRPVAGFYKTYCPAKTIHC